MHIRILLGLLFLSIGFSPLAAQNWQAFGSLHGGYTLQIHPDYPEITQPSFSGMLGVVNSNAPNIYLPNARTGIAWTWLDAGNPEILGQATGPMVFLDGYWTGRRKWSLRYALGTGFAGMTRTFNRQSNPTNIVVGSRITSLAYFQLYVSGPISKRYSLQVGLSAWHYSAARVRVPNLGINVPSLMIGLTPTQVWVCGEQVEWPEIDKRLRPGIRLGMGFTSRKTAGGPLYPVPTLMGMVQKRDGHGLLRWQAGFKAFYEESLFAFYQNQDFGRDTPQRDATGLIAWVGCEWLLGRLGINARLGPYLKRPHLMDHPLYTELGLQYYLNNQNEHFRNQPYLGLYVHAHSGEADWAELALGWMF